MKIKSITLASLLAAAVGAVAAAGVGWCFGAGFWVVATSAAAVFMLVGSVTAILMRSYVIHKIKPIYQIVLSKNLSTSDLERKLADKPNPTNDIRDAITTWVERNRREIDRLKEAERYRKEFIGNVSHEIKTPIFNIQGYILTLLDGGLEDPEVNRKYLERAERSIDRLINIVRDLDEISKLESGSLVLRREPFDIVALTRELADNLEMAAAKRDIRLKVGGVAQPPVVVRADRKYIEQVLVNLIVNSIRYGNQGGMTRIAFVDMFDKVMVEVADNGVGIAAEDIPRLFERFFRTDKSRSREDGGTGLGLAIVKHILEFHDESITVRSEPGEGSTFAFTLTKAKDN